MNSLQEQLSGMPTIEVEANKSYRYKIVKDGVTLGELEFHITEISYSQSGIETIRLSLTDSKSLKRITTVLDVI